MSLMNRFKSTFLTAATGAVLSLGVAGSAAAQQCPDWQLGGVPLTTDAQQAYTAQQYPMYAGGSTDLSQCGNGAYSAYGRTTAAPSFSVAYDAMNMGRELEFRVVSECDTVLLVNDSSAQWHYNDDADGTLSPRLRLTTAPSGRYDVWVGSYSGQSCPATLYVQTWGGTPTPPPYAPTCPDWQMGGAEMRMGYGQSDARTVVAGGSVNMFQNQCGIEAGGYVAQAPDFTLYYDPAGYPNAWLDISVTGECDTTLLINGQDATWNYNDDTDGFHPRVRYENAAAGRYDVWVGTYSPSTCNATLNVTSYAPQAVTPPPAAGK